MHTSVVHQIAEQSQKVASDNRQLLRQAGVLTLNLIGTAGCGKTSLINETLARLVQKLHISVVACDPEARRDADRLAGYADQVVQVDTGEGHLLAAAHLRDALGQLRLDQVDLLIIENISSIVGPAELDLGEDMKVGMFSVSEGDDKADKYADLVTRSGALILNKTDLLSSSPFDLAAFRGDVARVNPSVPLFEMSVLQGEGIDPWLNWITGHLSRHPAQSSHWFG